MYFSVTGVGGGDYIGERTVAARVLRDSYTSAKRRQQQRTSSGQRGVARHATPGGTATPHEVCVVRAGGG